MEQTNHVYNSANDSKTHNDAPFMSLVPQDEPFDDADNSVLEATMYDIKLNNSTWQATDIEHAWSVQGANITNLQLGNVTSNGSSYHTNDYIRIYHQYQLV